MPSPGTPRPVSTTGPAEMSYAEPGDLARVRAFVRDRARLLGLADARTDLLTIAVSELTTNTLQHTGGGGRVRLWAEDGYLRCEVADGGAPRELGREMPAPAAYRGRGLAIVERVCDEVSTASSPDGTRVRLGMRLRP
jgi:serine/threonine-protein kinase RsbW